MWSVNIIRWQWLYLSGPAQLLLHEHLLEVDGEGVDGVVLLQHDDTAWLGLHGKVYRQVSLFLLLVGAGKHNILLLADLHGYLLGLAA